MADLFARRQPDYTLVHEGSMAVGLTGMALAGWGVAWAPESLTRADLAQGALVRAADPSWDISVDIRLYRSRQNRRPVVRRVWQAIAEMTSSH